MIVFFDKQTAETPEPNRDNRFYANNDFPQEAFFINQSGEVVELIDVPYEDYNYIAKRPDIGWAIEQENRGGSL